ncbi:uncharacterized protein LY89DRAFT_785261 [Mollisia scopiformis]|uniref:Zn(2)-C6 fungal-type domain-containing protein n=1 Tax=Mollisia scopiformis TaxID=149040 RepID=A0A194X091_MOLSC|nr:uncharacterized protein LY89DRAFT_785261 [Mollisia scopiformis]KUJ13613.1 hypothetical protein LY89DRAFT_785261 [Mollisia scopiformis]
MMAMETGENVNSSRKRRRSFSKSRDGTEASWSAGESVAGTRNANRALGASKRLIPKANTACETCRQKKVKCNEGQPICGYCDTHGFRCDYRQRPVSSREQMVTTLLQRLALVEEKVERVENVILSGAAPANRQAKITQAVAFPNTPVETPSPLGTDAQFLLPSDQLWFHLLSEASATVDRAPNSYETPVSLSDEAATKSRYLGKSPFACEEDRAPLSDSTSHSEPTNTGDIRPWLQYYLEHACPMYPVMCDPSAQTISEFVAAQGFSEDIESCFSLLIVALAKAHRDEDSTGSGMSDFHRATHILSRVGTQFKTKYVQAHVLSALFLLKKGRLLDFWKALHTGCTLLYTMLKRDEADSIERGVPEKMNIRRIYWICVNFERDVRNEIDDTLSCSPLPELQDSFPLPLGCDELDLSHLPPRLRTTLTFFLAEMSLKAITERILTTVNLEFYVQDVQTRRVELSPLFQELRRQLDEWIESVPSLNWSSEPTKGLASPLATRVKLMYWFTRFSLFRPLIKRVLGDSGSMFPMLGWKLLREGLQAGHSLIKVTILEQSDIDVIIANRILSTICLLRETVEKGYFSAGRDEDISVVLQEGIDVLWNQLVGKSEWIKCRIYNL